MGPFIASLSPFFNEKMKGVSFPSSYFLIINVNSPGRPKSDMGVYGRVTGFPLLSLGPFSSAGRMRRADATGRLGASPFGV
jgi:hypothetical protein